VLATQRPADGEGNAVADIIRSKCMTKVMYADFSDADAEARLLPRFGRLGRWALFVVADDEVRAAFDRRNGLQDGEWARSCLSCCWNPEALAVPEDVAPFEKADRRECRLM